MTLALPEDTVLQLLEQHYSLQGEVRALPGYVDQNHRLTTRDGDDFVVKIMAADPSVLQAQNQLIKQNPDLKVDVLILPHHGSTTNLDNSFVESLKPAIVIASCSKRSIKNLYQPSLGSSMQAFNTAKDGAITVRINNHSSLSTSCYIKSFSDKQ